MREVNNIIQNFSYFIPEKKKELIELLRNSSFKFEISDSSFLFKI